jgi:hypothetical protein
MIFFWTPAKLGREYVLSPTRQHEAPPAKTIILFQKFPRSESWPRWVQFHAVIQPTLKFSSRCAAPCRPSEILTVYQVHLHCDSTWDFEPQIRNFSPWDSSRCVSSSIDVVQILALTTREIQPWIRIFFFPLRRSMLSCSSIGVYPVYSNSRLHP